MYTEYYGPINRKDLKGLEAPSRKLQQGGIVAFPTETTYGLGTSILNEDAIKRLFEVKGREETRALPVLIANLDQLRFVVSEYPEEAKALAEEFLPGPLTIVMKKHPNLSPLITGGKESVAVRFSSDPIARRLVEMTGCPLASPSANMTGKPSSIQASHVLEDFNGKVDGIVDGGVAKYGMESTLISLEDPSRPTILRFGVAEQKEIERVLNRKVLIHPLALTLNGSSFFGKLRSVVRLFSTWEEMKIYLKMSPGSRRLILSKDVAQIEGKHFQLDGKNLYEGLRKADREGFAEVLVCCNPELKKDIVLLNKLKQIART
ncbi:MAG: threonylcarbamoyl-AMP synthase [Chlamydiia bacterium]|nr:threonylcarbamoyl-AMP synthase [Chlamydiia bacterium]